MNSFLLLEDGTHFETSQNNLITGLQLVSVSTLYFTKQEQQKMRGVLLL
jgi:hypothetical protein